MLRSRGAPRLHQLPATTQATLPVCLTSNPFEEVDVTRDYVECAEVAGKTIKTLKIYEDDVDGCETLIEFYGWHIVLQLRLLPGRCERNLIQRRGRDSPGHPRLRTVAPFQHRHSILE